MAIGASHLVVGAVVYLALFLFFWAFLYAVGEQEKAEGWK